MTLALQMIQRLLKTLLGLTIVVLVGALTVLCLLPQRQPAAQVFVRLQVDDLNAAKKLLNRQQLRDAFHGQPLSITLPQLHLNALANDAAQRLLGASALTDISPTQARVTLSVPLQRTPLRALGFLGSWLNVSATLTPEPQGPPTLSALRIGHLPVPPGLALWVAQRVAAHHHVLEPALIGLSAIEEVGFGHATLQIHVRWGEQHTSRAFSLLLPAEDIERLYAHHQQLGQLLQAPAPVQHLVPVLSAMFEQARQRTLAQGLGSSGSTLQELAARENRAVLMALALYAVHIPPGRLLPAAQHWPELPVKVLLLHGRVDFAQHYVLSAMLATSLGGRLTEAAGLYKELLDASPGSQGSGFSFNDIAADKAGNRFGQRARLQSMELQTRAAEGRTDDYFMPNVSDLPQYLSQQALQQRFGGVGSATYNEMLGLIDTRVDQLAVLR